MLLEKEVIERIIKKGFCDIGCLHSNKKDICPFSINKITYVNDNCKIYKNGVYFGAKVYKLKKIIEGIK